MKPHGRMVSIGNLVKFFFFQRLAKFHVMKNEMIFNGKEMGKPHESNRNEQFVEGKLELICFIGKKRK